MTARTVDQSLPADIPGQVERPQWSAAEAARRCGVSRATIQRALTDGRLPSAVLTKHGWRIPLETLLAAGFVPSKSATALKSLSGSSDHVAPRAGDALRIAELETQVLAERARADLAVTQQSAAETLASERLGHVEDLRSALRVLESAFKLSTPTNP